MPVLRDARGLARVLVRCHTSAHRERYSQNMNNSNNLSAQIINDVKQKTPVHQVQMSLPEQDAPKDAATAQSSAEQQPQECKSKNQLKNEAKKAAKMEKFVAKQAKLASACIGNKTDSPKSSKPKKEVDQRSSNADDICADYSPNKVRPGEKKDMASPMAATYDPRQVESAWYSWWQDQGFFKPEYFNDHQKRPVFAMVIPPPNVTGSLHLGHAMMGSIEDALARWHRMRGDSVLFLPGCDHAGIATQAVVEKRLKREGGISRHDLGRDAFVAEVWKWKDQYGSRIYEQLKRLGLSLDWDRARFTLDEMSNVAVNEAFCRLFEEGLIFRANRLVNWSGKLKTALSDLEVEMKEIGPNSLFTAHNHDPKKTYPFGLLWSFAYKIVGSEQEEEIVIATTRPETLFADTAIAVNPNDARYAHLHGKKVVHPITAKVLPIICDEVADPEFGTGALKISPAHDPIDFAVGQRHQLPFVSIFDEDNRLSEECGVEYCGMQRYDARLKVIEEAKAKGLFRGDKSHPMVLPVCSRSGDFVEPRMMPQWWLNCRSMADKSMSAVREGLLKIVPEDQVKVWDNWLVNIRDWCLSRQLWWGHQVPAYEVMVPVDEANAEVSTKVLLNDKKDPVWVVGRDEREALQRARQLYHPRASLRRDPDVLDTWFSSALWPFSTLGWPNEQSTDFERFYPNTLLETGSDILFFWVARMVMMGVHLTNRVPFSDVFLHSIVRDAHGRKMSKSLGNVIDPIDVIEGITLERLHATLDGSNLDPSEIGKAKAGQKLDFPNGIPECGTDALRFALCSYVSHGREVNMNVNEVHAYRRFCNKLWQASRFVLLTLGDSFLPERHIPISSCSSFDKWILDRLTDTIRKVNHGFESYVLMAATKALYSFWLNDLCDVYIEAIKPIVSAGGPPAAICRNVLFRCLHDGLLLLHPMMPYVTEELYQRLPKYEVHSFESACIAEYPKAADDWTMSVDEKSSFERLLETVKEIRSIASDQHVPRGSRITLSGAKLDVYDRYGPSMAALVKAVGTLSLEDVPCEGAKESIHSTHLTCNPQCQLSFYPK